MNDFTCPHIHYLLSIESLNFKNAIRTCKCIFLIYILLNRLNKPVTEMQIFTESETFFGTFKGKIN